MILKDGNYFPEVRDLVNAENHINIQGKTIIIELYIPPIDDEDPDYEFVRLDLKNCWVPIHELLWNEESKSWDYSKDGMWDKENVAECREKAKKFLNKSSSNYFS